MGSVTCDVACDIRKVATDHNSFSVETNVHFEILWQIPSELFTYAEKPPVCNAKLHFWWLLYSAIDRLNSKLAGDHIFSSAQ